MEENKNIKIGLKTGIVIVSVIIVLMIVIFLGCNKFIKGDYIYNKEITSISIKYYEGYNIETGDSISDTIPLNTINLESENLKEVSKLVKALKILDISEKRKYYITHHYIFDYYKIEINGNVNLCIGDEYGIALEKSKVYFKVPKELYNKVLEIVEKNNKENLYKTINSKNITIISGKEKFEITDVEQLKEISDCQYYVITASDEEFPNKKIAYTLDLNDGRKIDIHFASVLSCIYYKNGTHEYIYTGKLEDLVEKIFENSKVKMDTNNVEKIKVTYKGKDYIIDDKNKIEDLLKDFKNLRYNDYNFLKSMTENNFDDNAIIIYVNKGKYIIPGYVGYGDRFYVDPDGKLYDVSGMGKNNLEKYFKELVDWKE